MLAYKGFEKYYSKETCLTLSNLAFPKSTHPENLLINFGKDNLGKAILSKTNGIIQRL